MYFSPLMGRSIYFHATDLLRKVYSSNSYVEVMNSLVAIKALDSSLANCATQNLFTPPPPLVDKYIIYTPAF